MRSKEIVRTKTGCFTCRRRRKKCDERKPTCRNCERNRLECEGYQTPRRWQTNAVTAKPAHLDSINPAVTASAICAQETHATRAWGRQSPKLLYDEAREPSHGALSEHASSTTPAWATAQSLHSLAHVNDILDSTSADFADSVGSEAGAQSFRQNDTGAIAETRNRDYYQQPSPRPLGSITLPSVVDGIENSLDKRLLHHFTHTFAKLLVATSDSSVNPFINLILPLALQDRGVWGLLDLILSLSASHLSRMLQKQSGSSSAELFDLEKSKWKHYSHAVTQHAKRLTSLISSSNPKAADISRDETQIDYAMATTMLLCQWSTCEGGDHSNWRMHLNANRDLVRRKFDKPAEAQPVYLSATSQTLLEWFYFHDVIATLTFPDQDCCIALHTGMIEAFGISVVAPTISKQLNTKPAPQIMWIGPNDGLLSMMSRTLSLRRSTEPVAPLGNTNTYSQSLDFITRDDVSPSAVSLSGLRADSQRSDRGSIDLVEALSIETELQEWSFKYETSQQQLMGQCYRLAVFLLLFFTVNPETSPKHTKIQGCLGQFECLIGKLSPSDNAFTCSLLPLFIFGVSAVTNGGRDLVVSQMDAYRRWSGLGHVNDVTDFLRSWWKEQDLVHSVQGPYQHHCVSNTNEPCPICQLRLERQSWWAWRDFMKARNLQLILI